MQELDGGRAEELEHACLREGAGSVQGTLRGQRGLWARFEGLRAPVGSGRFWRVEVGRWMVV